MRDPHLDRLIQDLKTKKFRDQEGKRLTDSFGENLKGQFGPVLDGMGKEIVKNIKESLSGLKMPDMPKMPETKIPDFPQPVVNVEAPIVNIPAPVVNIPAPVVNIPAQNYPEYPQFPTEMSLKPGARPFPVVMMDQAGKPMNFGGGATGGRGDFFTIKDIQTSAGNSVIDNDGFLKVTGSFTASSSNASTQLIDSSLNPFGTAANPLNVAITSGAASSTKAQIGNSDGDFSAANPLNVVFSSSGTTASALIDSTGVQYSGSNPLPVTFAGSSSTSVTLVNADGAKYDSSQGLPVTLQTALDATIDSISTYQASGATFSVNVTGATGTIASNIVDSSGIAFSGSNPLPVSAVISPAASTAVWINDSRGNTISAFPATFLRTTDEPHQLFYDAFDTTLDVTNRWTSTSGNSGVAASNTSGVMTMGTGTTANGFAKLVSQPTFTLPIPAWLGVSDAIALPDGASPVSNSYLYWGTGTTPGTPSVSTPVTDGYGFERNTDGKLRAVVYAGGTRTVVQDLSAATGNSTQPTDALYHRYIIYIRTDKAYWYIDGITSAQLVATSDFQSSQVQTLPRLFLTIGNSTPPVSNITLTCTGATAWDTGKNNVQLSDGAFPWRKSSINANGALYTESVQVSGTSYSTNIVGQTAFPIAEGDAATALRVVLANNVAYSTAITGPVVVSSVTASIQSALIDSSGVQYSGSNPLPITGPVVVTSITNTTAVALVDSSGVAYSGSNPLPIVGPVVVSSITASTQSALIDSGGVQYSGSNPVPVTLISSTTQNTNMVGGGNDSIFTYQARTTNPTAVADSADVRPKADKLGRVLMRPIQVRDLIATAYISLTTGTETTLLTAAAGTFVDLIMITATNQSTAATQLDIRATSAGNIIHTMYLPASTGPVGFAPSVPWPQDSTGNSWTIDIPDITGTTVNVSALFSKEI